MRPPGDDQEAPETLTIYDDPNDRYVVSLIISYSEAVLERVTDGVTEGFGQRVAEGIGEGVSEHREGAPEGSSALDRAVAEQPDKMKAAALAALELTRDAGSPGTHWYVYDRVTGIGRFISQSDFGSLGPSDQW